MIKRDQRTSSFFLSDEKINYGNFIHPINPNFDKTNFCLSKNVLEFNNLARKTPFDGCNMMKGGFSNLSVLSSISKPMKSARDKPEKPISDKMLIKLENIVTFKDKRTTIMLRNIPLKYNLSDVMEEISFFHGKIDFVNLPINLEVSFLT